MSQSNWIYRITIGGWLIGAIAIALALPALSQGSAPDNSPVGQHTAQQAPSDQQPPEDKSHAAFWKDKNGDAGVYREICKKPKDKEYADLCQQWRQSEAAEKQAEYSFWQLIAGSFGIVGLIVTLIYTHIALSQNRKTASSQLRAYVAFPDSLLEDVKVGKVPWATTTAKNVGQTPARDFMTNVAMALVNVPHTDFKLIDPVDDRSRSPLGPQCSAIPRAELDSPLTQSDIDALISGTKELYFWGEATYHDAFSKTPRASHFRMQLSRANAKRGNFVWSVSPDGNEAT